MALAVGAAGIGLTTTLIVPVELEHPDTVVINEYTPEPLRLIPLIDGFCMLDAKVFGPLQLYVAPANNDVLRFKVLVSHTGELLLNVGVDGMPITVTLTTPAEL